MSGHSKWSSIKHKKAAIDAKRGKVFTKVIKEITVAAREGGADMNANARLRAAVASAKAVNMPANNIERAIKKGTGELPGASYESVTYEGYGSGGVAVMVEVLTDNKNRTLPELRKIFEKNNGSLGAAGCVGWMFTRRGEILIKKSAMTEDKMMDAALEAGAEDIDSSGDEFYIVYTDISDFVSVKETLESKNIQVESASLAMIPQNEVKVSGSSAQQIVKLMEAVEDHDDVQNVYANFDIADEPSS